MPETYAVASDLTVRWRPLTPEETTRAEILMRDASFRIRRRFPQTTARLASGDLDPEEVMAVVVGMVKRAMIGGDADSLTSQTETAGPFSHTVNYANPLGNLFFTREDVAVLAGAPRRAFAVDLWQ